MKKFLFLFLSFILIFSLCACNDSTGTEETEAAKESTAATEAQYQETILGTWVCDDINEDCFFIFDANGDAYAKWGTCTVYGTYDYYPDENIYDIDVPNFLFNEYTASFNDEEMTLKSDESSFTFKRATLPEIEIKAPDNLKQDEKLIGDWYSEESYEYYSFNSNNLATIIDVMGESTVDCKYSCENGVITFYYMSNESKEGSKEMSYSFDGEKLMLDELLYLRAEE